MDKGACAKNIVSVETIQLCNVATKMFLLFSSEVRNADQDEEARHRRRFILRQNDDIIVETAVRKLVIENKEYLSLLTNVQTMAVEMESIASRSRDMRVGNENMRNILDNLRSQLDLFDANAQKKYSP